MRGLGRLVPYLARYRGQLAAGVGSILLAAMVGLLTPLVVGQGVDALADELSRSRLLGYAGIVVALTAVRGLFNFAQRRILVAMSRHIEFDLRNDFFSHLETLPGAFFQTSYTGDLMARATNDLQAVRMICGPAIMYGSNTVFSGLGALILMWRIDGKLTLLALCTLPVVAFATQYFGQRIHRLFEAVQEQFSVLSTRAQESFAGVRVVRAYAREESEAEAFASVNREYVARNRRLIAWTAAFHPLLQALIGIGFVAVLWFGGLEVYRGAITIGEFVAFNLFLTKLAWPMVAIGWVINLVQRGSASLERIAEVLRQEPVVRDRPGARALEISGRVTVRSLDFAYDAEAGPVLRGVDFSVEPGQTVGIIGRTGSGKSTLLSLLPRLFDPPPGRVLIDDVDVLEIELESLRGSIGFVPQETFLFSASIRDNILLGRPDAADTAVVRVAEAAGLGEDLSTFPQGIETMVGERGITLSGGQKQRVALARALIREPRILLLDDCLSAVDTGTEERILGHLDAHRTGRTVFLVSHRISTIRRADLILVLEAGEVVARGVHADLVAEGGLYADLHQRQQLEAELAAV